MAEEPSYGSGQVRTDLTAHELCDHYGDRVYVFATMVSRGTIEADDIAQDALVRAVRSLPRFKARQGGVEAWLWTIVVNVARSHRRMAFRRDELWDRLRQGNDQATAPPAEESVLAAMGDPEVIEAVRSLPARSRAAIALRFGADLGFVEVGHQMGISEAAAKMAVQRGLQKLRASLQERKYER